MAVYKKTYRGYDGALTPAWSRFLVIPRFAFAQMRASRFLTMFFLGTMIFPLLAAVFIYVHHSLAAMKLLEINPSRIVAIDASFFMTFLGTQSILAYLLTAFIGPGLVSPDLANNALPLYLSRPLTRAEYVAGKLSVLFVLLSAMTWIPGLLLFALQAYLEGNGWMGNNLRIAGGLFVGAWIWILLQSLLALAVSAWVKWKPVAGALMFGVFFVASGFGAAFNMVLRTQWGSLINISHLIGTVWTWLFDQPMRRGAGAAFFRVARGDQIPPWCIWASLAALCVFCLWMLARKVRGVEVARS